MRRAVMQYVLAPSIKLVISKFALKNSAIMVDVSTRPIQISVLEFAHA